MSIDNEERKKRCAEAMRAHGDAVYRLAFARCRNTADAEDIFQTTFLRFYASHTRMHQCVQRPSKERMAHEGIRNAR